VLNKEKVIEDFEKFGFKLVYSSAEDGIKGFKDENFVLKCFINRFLSIVYRTNKPEIIRIFRRLLDKILAIFSAHIILLVFQKL